MPRDLLIRPVEADELGEFLNITEQTFGEVTSDDDVARLSKLVRAERTHAAYVDDYLVGTAAAYEFRLTVPGGEVDAAGVTMVGVLPTHRRRGILTQLMRAQLDDVHERGEPLAVLWASEAAIYGRFGYGLASLAATIEADRHGVDLRVADEPRAAARLVPPEEAPGILGPVYDEYRRAVPGSFARSETWWREQTLSHPEPAEGVGPLFVVVLELDGRPQAYARYRVESQFSRGVPEGTLRVREAVALTPEAERELWRFLFGVDLVAKVHAWPLPVDAAIFSLVRDYQRLRPSLGHALYARVVDAEAALAARLYEGRGRVVLELRDAFCPWNEGRWAVGPDGVGRTRAAADVELGAEELGAVYLGGTTFAQLARAGRVRELREGALVKADALFRTTRAPWCPEVF